jgi:arylsulfatase A-like enzyme/Flp pilus assembly protein TadD
VRRAFLVAVVLATAACGRPETVERVVLVSIDTLRADHVGCYGAEGAATPTLDGLAARGVRFETAVSPAPITLPSHATLLTGQDPPRHGARHNGHFSLRADVPTLAEALRSAGFATSAFVSAFVLDGRFGLARGFDLYDDRLGLATSAGMAVGVESRSADRSVDAALAWLDGAPDRFFLWLHLYDPHADHAPPEPWATRFAGRPYDGEIAFADAELGRLLAGIAERFGEGGTLVVATSDHGESLGEHGEQTHSFSVYDATQRVPLLMAGPGLPRGRVVTAPIARLADVAPTVLALAGLPALAETDGESLLPAIEGRDAAPRVAWVETLATQLDFGWSPLLGVRTATHKYVRAPRPELYDIAADPNELVNRAADEPERVAELDALVTARAGAGSRAAQRSVSDEERSRLAALGYVESGAAPATQLGVVGGRDPKDELPKLGPVFEAMALLAHDRPREALARLVAFDGLGFDLELLRARAALDSGELALARRSAERAFGLSRRAPALVLLGEIAAAEGDAERARADFEHALALDPEHAPARVALGRLEEAAGRRDAARSGYEAARELPVPDPEAFWRLAALDIEEGRFDSARGFLAALPQDEVRKPRAAARLARAERSAGRPELARTRVAGALRSYPRSEELQRLAAELPAEKPGTAGR